MFWNSLHCGYALYSPTGPLWTGQSVSPMMSHVITNGQLSPLAAPRCAPKSMRTTATLSWIGPVPNSNVMNESLWFRTIIQAPVNVIVYKVGTWNPERRTRKTQRQIRNPHHTWDSFMAWIHLKAYRPRFCHTGWIRVSTFDIEHFIRY